MTTKQLCALEVVEEMHARNKAKAVMLDRLIAQLNTGIKISAKRAMADAETGCARIGLDDVHGIRYDAGSVKSYKRP